MKLITLLTLFAAGLNAAGSCSVVNNAGPGTVQIAANGVVTGTSTSFAANTILGSPGIGAQICVAGTCAFITAFSTATSVTVGGGSWSGTTAGGQSYTIGQVVHPNGTNNTNILQFFANFTAGSTLLHASWIDTSTAERPQLITTGTGESFTPTPASVAYLSSGNSYWLSYLPATLGGTNLIYFGIPGGDFWDDLYGMEISCTGGLVSFDINGVNGVSMPVSATSGVVWAVGHSSSGTLSAPLTSYARTGSGGVFGYQMNPSTPLTVTVTGPGAILASLKIIQPQPTGFGGTGGLGGSAGLNVANTNGTITGPTVCGIATATSAATKTTVACNTTGATAIAFACNTNSSAVMTLSDSASNNWNPATNPNVVCTDYQFSGSFSHLRTCSLVNPTTSASHTFTCAPGATTGIALGAEAISGTPTGPSAIDKSVTSTSFSASATIAATSNFLSAFNFGAAGTVGTGVQGKTPGTFYFLFCGSHNFPTAGLMTISSPFVKDSDSSGGFGGWMGHYLSTNGAGVNPTCNAGTFTGLTSMLVGFQPIP